MILRALITGFIAGLPAAWLFRQLAFLEVPLSTSNLISVLAYLFLARGLIENLVIASVAKSMPRRTAEVALSVALGFGLALTADPLVAAQWESQPLRAAVVVLLRPLVATQWIPALVNAAPLARPIGEAAWRGGLLAILDRETGLATVVEVLLALQLLWIARGKLKGS
jgi:hypothetical protein